MFDTILTRYQASKLNGLNIVHVAGSKGKGTTATMTASILSQFLSREGPLKKIGIFTSPHVRTVRERIQIIKIESSTPRSECPQPISEREFARYFLETWDVLHSHHAAGDFDDMLSYFPFLFAVALRVFFSEQVDVAIIECGIGGELDSTNVVGEQLVSGITTLELEHTDLLGNSLRSIAWHKGGIMRPGVCTFTVPQKPEAMEELERRAKDNNATLIVTNTFKTLSPDESIGKWHTINAGLAENLATAVLRHFQISDANEEKKIAQSLHSHKLLGRYEQRKALSCHWYIDGAHTLTSLAAVTTWFSQLMVDKKQAQKFLIFNQEDRDTLPMLDLLYERLCVIGGEQLSGVLFCSNSPFSREEYPIESISMVRKFGLKKGSVQRANADHWQNLERLHQHKSKIQVCLTVQEAVEHVLQSATTDVHCLATGSLHLVGALTLVLDQKQQESPAT